MESEERKKDRKDFFFFSPCEQLCSFLFLPVSRKGWELLFDPAVQPAPRSQSSQKSFKAFLVTQQRLHRATAAKRASILTSSTVPLALCSSQGVLQMNVCTLESPEHSGSSFSATSED